ncbi:MULTISPECIES: TIGR03758 family integrating conjugative element protein [Shewanella]|jgi:integrating conjugative element protein (TIGR03758 family)|uniref:TIGR03758 family integrating conjugative element protein n=1 Tax=Shewanella TaxID=22 RepID=UPI00021130B2|nr:MULTISPECIES: TIGR03758 family integrating conjugative element protein [Shewanella]AEH16380.1 integrating conjugative element protein, PFL_4701 family [Shewanella baltica OS117]NRD34628.1 TIGR03758 family integrating conjugative element protein [Shewanella sp. DC2-4]GCF90539.1 hypothetical protein SMBr_27830 [Shewanella sp. M-Br]
MNEVLSAFEHGAGFSADYLALLIAVVGMIIITAWAIWVGWSVYRGFKSGKTDRKKFIHAMQRTMLIWLVLNFILFTGVI